MICWSSPSPKPTSKYTHDDIFPALSGLTCRVTWRGSNVHLCTITSTYVKLDVDATTRSRNLQTICEAYMPQCTLHDEVRLFLAETGEEISINPANRQHDTPEFTKAWSFLRLKMLEAALKNERCSQLDSSKQPEPTVVHVQVSTYSNAHFAVGKINRTKYWDQVDFYRLSDKDKDNFWVASGSIKRDGRTYNLLNDHLWKDRRLALLAATTGAVSLCWFPEKFQTDPEIVLAAIKHSKRGKSVHDTVQDILTSIKQDKHQKVLDIVSSAGLLDEVGK